MTDSYFLQQVSQSDSASQLLVNLSWYPPLKKMYSQYNRKRLRFLEKTGNPSLLHTIFYLYLFDRLGLVKGKPFEQPAKFLWIQHPQGIWSSRPLKAAVF